MLSGTLFIIATPIGNLSDLGQRAKECLAECDVIFAEDTRRTAKLTNHLGLKKRLISCHEFNEKQRIKTLEEYATKGARIALVSDAGTPLISDPGFYIVEKAIQLGLSIVPIPGPSAILLALVASGIPCRQFVFEGFLADTKKQRLLRLQELSREERTLVFFLAPHDVKAIVSAMLEIFGPRKVCLARELTKKHEQFVRAELDELVKEIENLTLRGEFVLIVEGAKSTPILYTEEMVLEQLAALLKTGSRLKDASAQVAKVSGWPRSKIYKLGLGLSAR